MPKEPAEKSALSKKQVTVLGAGKMGTILLQAWLKQGLLSPARTRATVQHAERARSHSQQLGIPVTTDNLDAVRKADIIVVAVKPAQVRAVLAEIAPVLSPKQLLISIAASVPTAY